MKANAFIQAVGLIAFLLFAILGAIGHYYIGLAIFASFFVWYIKKGQHLKGWISTMSIRDMEAEAQDIESLSRQWRYPNGDSVPMEERRKFTNRRTQLLMDIADAKREQR